MTLVRFAGHGLITSLSAFAGIGFLLGTILHPENLYTNLGLMAIVWISISLTSSEVWKIVNRIENETAE